MIAWLESLSTIGALIVVVGGFVASTMAMGLVVVRLTSHDVRAAHNEMAGFILAVLGVVYAVLLAFVAIGVWERYEHAQELSYQEADALATIYRDAQSFPDAAKLRSVLRQYAESIVTVEWPKMRRGDNTGITDTPLDTVDRYVRALPSNSASLQAVQSQMLDATATAFSDRDGRFTREFVGINELMWAVLILGAYITVGFTYLFGFDRTVMQQIMIGGLSLMIGLVLFLVVALDFPFRGGISVAPTAFTGLLKSWNP